MSATNRGTVRRENDYYPTPFASVHSLFNNANGLITQGDTILEPSAGAGNIIHAIRECGYDNPVTAIDIQNDMESPLIQLKCKVIIDDFLKRKFENRYDVIIGNPPYSLAQEFVEKSLQLLRPKGRLIFLLRTSFLESKKRFYWWQDKLPTGLYVLHKRPSFTGKGTDATSYSWFVWVNQEQKTGMQTIKVI